MAKCMLIGLLCACLLACGGGGDGQAASTVDLKGQWFTAVKSADSVALKALLLRRDITLNWQDKDGATALTWAAWLGYEEGVRLLLDAGVTTGLKTALPLVQGQGTTLAAGSTALLAAVTAQHTTLAQGLLQAGASVNDADAAGMSVLMWAVVGKNSQLLGLVLDQKPVLNARSIQRETALWHAVAHDNTTAWQKLLDMGADPDLADLQGDTPLVLALRQGNEPAVRDLLAAAASISIQQDGGAKALLAVAEQGSVALLAALQHTVAGLNLDVADAQGRHPLMQAARFAQLDMVQALLAAGVRVDAADHSGATALMEAAQAGDARVFSALENMAADLNRQDNKQRPLLFYVVRGGNIKLLQTLLQAGQDPNAVSAQGETLLMNAVHSSLAMVQQVLGLGGDVNQADRYGWPALFEAAALGKVDIVDYLLQQGAKVSSVPQIDAQGKVVAPGVKVLQGHRRGVQWIAGGWNVLMAAAQAADDVVLRRLLSDQDLISRLPDINATTDTGWTALMVAISVNNDTGALLLLNTAGINPRVQANDGESALTLAAAVAKPAVVERILEQGINLEVLSGVGLSPLMIAAERGDTGIVQALLTSGAQTGTSTDTGLTALMLAARSGQLASTQAIIQENADVNQAASNAWTALMAAALSGHVDVLDALLQAGALVAPQTNAVQWLDDWQIQQGATALMAAVVGGNSASVQKLLAFGAKPNARIQDGWTAVMLAAALGRQAMLEDLLAVGADVNIVSRQERILPGGERVPKGSSALHIAVIGGHAAVVTTLLQAGAKTALVNQVGQTAFLAAAAQVPPSTDVLAAFTGLEKVWQATTAAGKNALHLAAEQGSLPLVQQLLQTGKLDVNGRDNQQRTPLMLAVQQGHGALISLLVQAGAELNAVDAAGETVLMQAVRSGSLSVVKAVLAEPVTQVNALDNKGQHALMIAARLGLVPSVDVLIRAKSVVDLQANAGQTALMEAVDGEHLPVVKRLLQETPDSNLQDAAGITALWLAAAHGRADIARLLLDTGALVNVLDKGQGNALMQAAKSGDVATFNLLMDRGADFRQIDDQGRSTLLFAARAFSLPMVQRLIQDGADVNATAVNKETPLLAAVATARLDTVTALVQAGASVNQVNAKRESALLLAMHTGGAVPIREFLLDLPQVDVTLVNQRNETALWWAVRVNNLSQVSRMLAKGAARTANRLNAKGNPLLWAASHGYLDIIKAMVAANAAPTATAHIDMDTVNKDGKTALILAVEHQLPQIWGYLLQLVPKVALNIQDVRLNTAVLIASGQGDQAAVTALLNAGADASLTNTEGWSLLMAATASGNTALVNELVNNHSVGLDASLRRSFTFGGTFYEQGSNALIIAITNADNVMLDQLLKLGADPDAGDFLGMPPLISTARAGEIDMVRSLLASQIVTPSATPGGVKVTTQKTPANINARARRGIPSLGILKDGTALMMAVGNKDQAMLDLLLQHAADPNLLDSTGETAVNFAIDISTTPILDALLTAGANPDIGVGVKGVPAVHASMIWNGLGKLDSLLAHQANLDLPTSIALQVGAGRAEIGSTPVMIAVLKNNGLFLFRLLDAGANPNLADAKGNTPLARAIALKFTAIEELLRVGGAK